MKALQFEEIVMPVPTGLAGKFANLHDALRGELVELDPEIHGGCLAIATGSSLLLLGEPGIAKSYLGNRLFARISGMRYFHDLLDPFTDKDDIFGPLDLLTLKASGARIRLIKGYLPTADVANLEEIFNTSASLQRSLHMITYEHKFRQGAGLIDVPLKVMFCSTNDLPKGGASRAFRDRILQTYEVKAPQEKANIVHMLKHKPVENPDAVLTWEEVLEAQAAVKKVHIPDAVLGTIAEIQRQLDDENMAPSPRRLVMCTDLLRGEAWLEGAEAVSSDHLPALIPALWDTPDQISKVEEVVLQHANPLEKETLKLLNGVDEIAVLVQKGVDEKDAALQATKGREAYQKVRKAHQEYSDLLGKAGGSRRQLGLLQNIQDKLHTQSVTLLADVFHVTDGSVKLPNQP